ncbi:MAG: lipopolysaccharide export system permease protein [Candidatus Azotimanducaceae bacterium]|jgi:lipopolysaccharide export system permease protein
MLAVAGVVLVISMGWRFSGYLTDAANGAFTKDVLLLVMAYKLPSFLELILPISFFLAIMLAYGRLHVDSEMVILESTGMSPARLINMTLALSFVVMLVTGIISLWLKPLGEYKTETMFADQRNLTEFDTLGAGRFQSLRSGKRVTYTESLDGEGGLLNVFINEYKSEDQAGAKDVITVLADKGATVVDDNGNRFLVLKNGTRHSGRPGELDYQVISYEEYGQFIQKEKAELRHPRRKGLSTLALIEEKTPRNISELQWRISVILMIPIMAVLAIPLSRVNPRQGRFSRLLPGMTLCFLYIVLLSAARSGVEKETIPVELGIWWVHVLYVVLIYCLYNSAWFALPKKLMSRLGSKS